MENTSKKSLKSYIRMALRKQRKAKNWLNRRGHQIQLTPNRKALYQYYGSTNP